MALIRKLFRWSFDVRKKIIAVKDRITGINTNKLVKWESMIPERPIEKTGIANLFLVAERLSPYRRRGRKIKVKAMPVAAETKVMTNR